MHLPFLKNQQLWEAYELSGGTVSAFQRMPGPRWQKIGHRPATATTPVVTRADRPRSERKTNVICEAPGRRPCSTSVASGQHTARWPQVLDPRTERVVARNPNLQEFFFFRSKVDVSCGHGYGPVDSSFKD